MTKHIALSVVAVAAAACFGLAGKVSASPVDLLGNGVLGIYLKDLPAEPDEHKINLNGGTGTTVTGNVQGVAGTPTCEFHLSDNT